MLHCTQSMKIPAFPYPAWNNCDSSKYECGKCTPSYGLRLPWENRWRTTEERQNEKTKNAGKENKKIWYDLVTLLFIIWWTMNWVHTAKHKVHFFPEVLVVIKNNNNNHNSDNNNLTGKKVPENFQLSYLRFQDMVRYSFVESQLSFRFTC